MTEGVISPILDYLPALIKFCLLINEFINISCRELSSLSFPQANNKQLRFSDVPMLYICPTN